MDKICSFREVLNTITERSTVCWVYLPIDEIWSIDSNAATLEMNEVSPDMEDMDDAGRPELAIHNNLKEVIDVSTLQDVIKNLHHRKPNATDEDKFNAFCFYYNNDAFMFV